MTGVVQFSTASQARPEVERDRTRGFWTSVTWIGLAFLLAWSWNPAEMYRWPQLFSDAGNMATYAAGVLKPDFKEWRYYLQEMATTIQWTSCPASRYSLSPVSRRVNQAPMPTRTDMYARKMMRSS